MTRLLVGLILAPSAALTLAAAGRCLGAVALRAPASSAFVAGLALAAAFWALARYAAEGRGGAIARLESLSRRVYVFGHELTHALAAWSVGARVLSFNVADSGGHVDLSHSNAFVALAPYCLPIYTLLLLGAYRAFLWAHPAGGGQALFQALTGGTVAFHALKTFECLWDRRQPDLAAAGGTVFSLSLIVLSNGLVVLILLKALFPRAVDLFPELARVGRLTGSFWTRSWEFIKPVGNSFVAQMRRP